MAAELVLYGLLGVAGLAIVGAATLVLRRIDTYRREGAVLAGDQRQTVGDYLILAVGTGPLLFGFLLYAIGAYTGVTWFRQLALFTGVIAAGAMTAVLVRWWRRFP